MGFIIDLDADDAKEILTYLYRKHGMRPAPTPPEAIRLMQSKALSVVMINRETAREATMDTIDSPQTTEAKKQMSEEEASRHCQAYNQAMVSLGEQISSFMSELEEGSKIRKASRFSGVH